MEITGIIEEIFPERIITEKYSIKEFSVKIDGQYIEYILFQCSNQQIKLLDSFMEGEQVTVHFNLAGRKAKGRYWNSLKVWKIEAVERQTTPVNDEKKSRNVNKNADCNDQFNDDTRPATETHPLPAANESEESDLPF